MIKAQIDFRLLLIEARDIVRVQTVNGQYKAKQLIVTAGAWATELLQTMDVSIPVTPTRKTFAWFDAEESLYAETHFPAYCFELRTALITDFQALTVLA